MANSECDFIDNITFVYMQANTTVYKIRKVKQTVEISIHRNWICNSFHEESLVSFFPQNCHIVFICHILIYIVYIGHVALT